MRAEIAPAIAVVWWHVTKNLEPVRPMLVCAEHFQQILKTESKKGG